MRSRRNSPRGIFSHYFWTLNSLNLTKILLSKDDVDNAAFEEMILELVYNLRYLRKATWSQTEESLIPDIILFIEKICDKHTINYHQTRQIIDFLVINVFWHDHPTWQNYISFSFFDSGIVSSRAIPYRREWVHVPFQQQRSLFEYFYPWLDLLDRVHSILDFRAQLSFNVRERCLHCCCRHCVPSSVWYLVEHL